eukprot:m.446524 g.446524  ORF g.446524 m.446524 type:complete len:73 (+) comp19379_c0_seq1:1872-2090(+)
MSLCLLPTTLRSTMCLLLLVMADSSNTGEQAWSIPLTRSHPFLSPLQSRLASSRDFFFALSIVLIDKYTFVF